MSTVALFQQKQKGKIRLDDPVSNDLDFKIKNEDPNNPIKFRHLFTHTSGLTGDFGAVPVWSNAAPIGLNDYVRNVLNEHEPPMTRVEYSNPAFTLVGYLVEKISGIPYVKYIQDNVWDPLEMKST